MWIRANDELVPGSFSADKNLGKATIPFLDDNGDDLDKENLDRIVYIDNGSRERLTKKLMIQNSLRGKVLTRTRRRIMMMMMQARMMMMMQVRRIKMMQVRKIL